MTGRLRIARLTAFAGALLAGALVAHAAPSVHIPPRVQGNPDVPYEAFNGAPTMLMAVVEGEGCVNGVQAQWDINGDGDYADANEELRNYPGNGYFSRVEMDVQYPAAEGDRRYFPKVRVTCGGGDATATMPVQVWVDRVCSGLSQNNCNGEQNLNLTRRIYVARMVNRSQWWLFKGFTHATTNGVHTCYNTNGSYDELVTGHTLNVFLRRGHAHGPNRDHDVYYRHMSQCGLHWFMSRFTDADTRYGDRGWFLNWGSNYRYSYSSTAWVEPFAMFGNPDYMAPVGPAANTNLRVIGQRLANTMAHCQGANGWWHYTCRQNGTDASTNGWPPEALRLLQRKLGVDTHAGAKNAQRNMLNGHCDHRGCYYHGWRASLAGNGLTGYGWTEDEVYDPNNANVQGLLQSAQGYNYRNAGLYYMYATTKGMRAFNPEIKYYPNGTDWNARFTDFLLARYQANGSYTTDNSYLNRGGDYAETAVATQIIQSWLESFAIGRAVPQLSGPGIPITFDHSWSYIQDPSITFTRFCWKFEGDAPAAGQADDQNLWDWCTADINESREFAYDADLDWGEVERHQVTLGVRDSVGRWVYDTDSVEIKLSLLNHKPVVVPHPDGPQAQYAGYANTEIVLDGRSSYDTDTDHEVFPGDAETPQGIPDRITSIHFDLNLDGDYDDEGEDGLNGPVIFVPTENMAVGDLIAVPMRVCDDGQWNGECFDGVDQPDCTECAFGSADVRLIPNVNPPVIDIGTCDENGQNCQPYVIDEWGPIEIDLGGSRDPEGVLGLRFQYEVVEGEGRIELEPEFRGNEANMGPTFTYHPEPDGPRVDRIRATVFDQGGLSSEAIIRVVVPNQPPVIDDFQLAWTYQPPVVRDATIENLGNGWYRLVVDAVPNREVLARATVEAHDAGNDDLTYQVDVDGNGRFDIQGGDDQPEFGNYAVMGGRPYDAALRVTDDADAVTAERRFMAPENQATLQYFFDLGADGNFEVAGGAQGHYDFRVPAGTDRVQVAGRVVDSNGNASNFQGNYELGNENPVFESAEIITVDGFDVVISASAVDPDGDQVTYRIDWGDGGEAQRVQGGVARHSYPENVFRGYTIRIVAEDGRGGSTSTDLAVDFPEPPANNPPAIEVARVISKDTETHEVLLSVSASDADDDALTYTIAWGDGTEDRLQGNLAFHAYPVGVFRTYNIRVLVEDGRGGSDEAEVEVDFPEPAANRAPIIDNAQVLDQDGFEVIFNASAIDPDGDDVTLTVNWGDGSEPSVVGGGLAAHTYPEGVFRAYTITVTAEDGREGRDVEEVVVEFEAPPPNQPPAFEFARVLSKDGFNVVISAAAVDPEDQPLTFTVDWGDGGEPTRMQAGLAEHDYPVDVFRAYTITITVRDPDDGEATRQIEVNFPEPAANRPPVFEVTRIISQEGFDVVLSLSATDPDADVVSYLVDWGDGSAPVRVQGGLAEHSYPAGAYRAYTIHVTADDGRAENNTAEAEVIVDFPEPAPNNAPVIETARELSRDGFDIVLGATANDVDGDQLTYTVEWGDGSRPTTMRGGIAEHSYRNGVYRAYTVTVTVTDGRGGEASREVLVNFAPPAENQAPEFEFVGVINKQGFQVTIAASAVDPDGDQITYTVLWGDGTPEMELRDQQASHRYPDGLYEDYTIRVLATDGQGGQAVRDLPVAFRRPGDNGRPVFTGAEVLSVDGSTVMVAAEAIDPDGDPIRYTIDWGDGSPEGEIVGGVGEHDYPVGRFGDFTIRVTAHDGNGASQTVELDVTIRAPGDNADPVIDEVQVLPQDGFEAVVLVDARDPDGDALTYTVSWGDGTEPVRGGQDVLAHAYPVDIYRSYTVTITVEDGMGGRAVVERELSFPEPADNEPPVIEGVDVQVGVRGEITLRITASDPEEAGLVYAVQWGDMPGWVNLVGGVGSHAYAWDAQGYEVRVRVTDLHGNAVFDRIHVDIVDAPTVVHDVRVDVINARQVRAAIVASDADGSGMLQYGFDFDGDGVYELDEQAEGTAVHTFAADGDYTVGIRVRDPWSGAWVERQVPVRIDMAGEIGDGAPIIGGIIVERGEGGCVEVQVDAADPEEGVLGFTIGWGDESNPDLMDDGAARHCYEAPAEGDGFSGWVEVRDEDGNVTRQDVLIEVVDQPTVIDAIDVQVVGQGRYLVSVRATDADGAERLRYSFDFNGDGNPEVDASPLASAAFTYIAPGRFLVRVQVTDSWSGVTVEDTVVVEYQQVGGNNRDPIIDGVQVFPGPAGHTRVVVDARDPDGDDLTVAVHWGDEADDGALSPGAGNAAEHRYALPGEGDGYDGYVIVTDPAGGTARMDFRATVVDRPTVIDEVVIEDRGYGAFVFDVRAHDPDGVDRLVYAFDADADGTWDRPDAVNTSALFQWDIAGPQTVRVRVTDTWSGASVIEEVTVQVLPWQDDNQPPVIHAVEVEVGARGHVLVSVVASDPDGGALDYVIHWGDEADEGAIEPMVGQTGEHDYPYGEGSWRGYVLVTDGSGTSVRGWFDAQLVDAPTVIREVAINRVRDGVVMVNVLASDADGAEHLRYSFDFDNDGTWDIEQQINPNALHEFAEAGAQTVRVGVTDSWSGATVEGEGVIELDVWIPDALPPEILAIDVDIAAGGYVTLAVEANDPEGGFLDVQVRWGDEADEDSWEALVGFNGDHTYAYPAEPVPYLGTVVVTDPDGLTATQAFEARIVDAPTTIREIAVSVIREGQIRTTVRATDPDTMELTYAFDFDQDGTFEIDGQAEASAQHTYEVAGEYTFTVGVTDPWSGTSTTQEHSFVLDPWIDEVPIADDHLEGEEGRCLVFRIGDEPGELETKVDPTVCDREVNPDAELWTWDFGDGTTARGSEVGHRYQDDGIYDVVITGGNPERPRRSRIQVFIANAAPEFITQPRTEAYLGELYQYVVRLEDQGPTDEVRLVLSRGPDGMVVGRGDEPGEWVVAWEVPVGFEAASVEVELRAQDGHTVDGEWVPDDGETVQNYEVQVNGLRDETPTPSDMGVDAGDPAFDAYTGSNCSCDVADDNGPDGTFLFLLGFGLLGLRRRRR